jgi:hypothetical protein
MKRTFELLSIIVALCSVSPWAIAQETLISCPLPRLDSAVVSNLPDGWWATPQQGELLSTQVQVVGGQATLVCRYAGFGGKIGVMREAPANTACTPTPKGFTCLAALTPVTQSSAEVPVVSSGQEASGRVSGPTAPTQSGPRPQVTPPNVNPPKLGDPLNR